MTLLGYMTELIPGAVGGACTVFVGHPMDLVKVRMQAATNYMVTTKQVTSSTTVSSPLSSSTQRSLPSGTLGTFGTLRTIFVQDGLSGLYRGATAPLLAATPAFAIVFCFYDVGKTLTRTYMPSWTLTNGELSIPQIALAGAFSGIPQATVIGPSERIKCLMQLDTASVKYKSFMDCTQRVYQEGGIRSIYKGFGVTLARDVPGNLAYFGMYELTRRTITRARGAETPDMMTNLFAGGMAGVGNWIVAIPVDTLKSRVQTSNKRLGEVYHHLVRTEGYGALFHGLSPALLRAFPANAACFAGVETVRNLMMMNSES